jgi:subtilisin family serine protease
MKTYNVILKKDVDYDGFWEDMETETEGLIYIPNRRVDYTNERLGSLRQCWYSLTDEEADLVRNDNRVFAVEIPPEHRDDLIIGLRAVQNSDFTKTTSDSGDYVNWGLVRCSSKRNIYVSGTTTDRNYGYSIDGSGVDIIIQDSGIQVDHPEFEDADGNSRVQLIDWGSFSGGNFDQDANHNRDLDGHGTHVAGIAAGKTYGWAKGAKIYSQKIQGLEGDTDGITGISPTYAFDTIKFWHQQKPIDPKTGAKRPTIVNMSWGYLNGYNTVTSVVYRGDTFTDGSTTSNASYRETTYGIQNLSGASIGYNYVINQRVASVDSDIQEMLDEGIIVCIAAGNRGFKIDIEGGVDYNNLVYTNRGPFDIHRGSSPHDSNAFIVGNIDSSVYDGATDQKSTSSEAGPGVNIWAPGTNIMSCTSTINKWGSGSQNYYLNSSFKQTNISGTSMAAPQVAGVAALILQMNPKWTPQQVKDYMLNISGDVLYSTLSDDDWTDSRSIVGSEQRILFSPFKHPFPIRITGLTTTNINMKVKQI